jgi:hypothetical protein
MGFYVKNQTTIRINIMVEPSDDPECEFCLTLSLKELNTAKATYHTSVEGRGTAGIPCLSRASNIGVRDQARLFSQVVDKPPNDRYLVIKSLVN